MDLSDHEIERRVSEIHDYQITHGSLLKLVKFQEQSTVPARPVGVSVVPSEFPRSLFTEAVDVQQSLNELYVRAGSDFKWLEENLAPICKHDPFAAILLSIHLAVHGLSLQPQIVCGIFRSDYMLENELEGPRIKQVEMNTFSCAGACHAERIACMHRHLLRTDTVDLLTHTLPKQRSSLHRLPRNNNTAGIVTLLTKADSFYKRTTSNSSCVLMVVQPRNFNIADERPIEYGLWDQGIPCYRCEWQSVLERTTMTEDGSLLFKAHPERDTLLEISVIYYRAGYHPDEYDEQGRRTRQRLESSRAVNCPNILIHLMTFKSVQEILTRPAVVERYLPAEKAIRVRRVFGDLRRLDESSSLGHRLLANPSVAKDYVLKPNLEGGGHNVYGEDIPGYLAQVPQEEWSRFVLMKLIRPPEGEGLLMMPSGFYQGNVISELGIVGTCLWTVEGGKVEMLENEMAGWTLKTKPADVDEMSVVKGYGCFDCPALTDS